MIRVFWALPPMEECASIPCSGSIISVKESDIDIDYCEQVIEEVKLENSIDASS